MIDYLWQCGSLLLIILGPVPCLASVRRLQGRSGAGTVRVSHDCLMMLTAWCGIEVLVGLFLGSMGCLRVDAVLLSESALLLIGTAIFHHVRRRAPLSPQRTFLVDESDSGLFLIGTLMLIGTALWWNMWMSPIIDFDSLWYHLPTMVNWYQSGTLAIPDHETIPAYYPFTWELLSLLFLLPFHADAFVTVPNLIAWIVFGCSIYALSGMCGATRLSALVACCLALSAPLVTEHMLSLHVDFPMAAFFLAGLYFLLSFHRSRSGWDAAFFVVSLALLCGIKTSGLIYGALLCAVWVLLEIQTFLMKSFSLHGQSGRHPLLQPVSLVAAGLAAIVAGYWYVRNFFGLGNPIGPFHIDIAGAMIFPGVMDLAEIRRGTSLAGLFSVDKLAHWTTLVSALKTNFSVPLLVLFLSAGLLPYRIVKEDQPSQKLRLLIILVLLVGAGVVYWTTPYSAEDLDRTHQGRITPFIGDAMRYAFPLAGLLAIAGAASISMLPVREEGFLVMGATTAGMYFANRTMAILAWVGFIVVWSVPAFRARGRALVATRYALPVRLGMVMLCLLLVALAGRVAMQERAEKKAYSFGYFGILDFLDTNVKEEDSIGYFMSQPTYVLFGKNLNRRVVYVDARSLSLPQWVDKLKERNVQLVALGPIDGRSVLRPELVWLESPDGPFTRIYGHNVMGETLLYRLK